MHRVETLIRWIKRNSEAESALLTPYPSWSVNSHSLLEEISNLFNIPGDVISEIIKEEDDNSID